MIGAVSSCHNGFGNAHRRMLPTWIEIASIPICDRMLNPTLPLSFGPWRYKEKMATPEQKAFRVLQFAKVEVVVSLQQAFRWQFQRDLTSASSIRRWYKQFQTTGYLCEGKSAGRPRFRRKCGTSEIVFTSQSEKSVRHASRELEMSTVTVWRMLWKRLEMKPNRLYLLQFLQLFWYLSRKMPN
jgi:transposase